MPAFSGDFVLSSDHQHNFTKRTGTNTNIAGAWASIPFATLAEGAMAGITTPDNIVFTLASGLWTVGCTLTASAGAAMVGALYEGSAGDPYNVVNTEVYAVSPTTNTGGVGAVNLFTQILVSGSSKSVRCSAFAATGTLRSATPGIPRITFSWKY